MQPSPKPAPSGVVCIRRASCLHMFLPHRKPYRERDPEMELISYGSPTRTAITKKPEELSNLVRPRVARDDI